MKGRFLFLLMVFFACDFAVAKQPDVQNQNVEKCGTARHIEFMKSRDSGLAQRLIDDENILQQALNNVSVNDRLDVYTIPVVVHVVYFSAGQNISDAQIQSQIDVLNEDFARLNSDRSNTPNAFATIASATNFRFCLAKRDPNGNTTNGIERRETTVQTFDIDDDVKSYAAGGLDAWDVDAYLNIWVCDLGGFVLGYSEPPSTVHTNTFGSVIHYAAFGRTGVVTAPYNLGRTCTHEIGHCLNLKHTFGDDAHCGPPGDNVYDTPDQDEASFGCLTFPRTDLCSPGYPGVMFMNYMDYSDDDCANMFTHFQSVRMMAAVNVFYPSLMNSNGCLTIGMEEISGLRFSIYPNPTNGIVRVDVSENQFAGKEFRMIVTDAIGRHLVSSTIQNLSATHQLDLRNFTPGIYYVTLTDGVYRKTQRVTIIQ